MNAYVKIALAAATILCGASTVAPAQDAGVVGVWRAREGTPSTMGPGYTASDVQTLYLYANGQYQREIVVEGPGAGGTLIERGEYRFIPPETMQYARHSFIMCNYGGCVPASPAGPDTGAIQFRVAENGTAQSQALIWTRVQ